MPHAIVVSPAEFARAIVPALRAESASLGGIVKSLPVEEVDVRWNGALRADPAAALAQTRAVARAIGRIAPGQDYLIDNVSNTLTVARADAAIGKRMFLFLGLPASCCQARWLPTRGACWPRRSDASRPTFACAARTAVTSCGCSRTGRSRSRAPAPPSAWRPGSCLALAVLGSGAVLEAAPADLALSALAALAGGLLATGLALFVPGRRALVREIGQERRELALSAPPAWRRLRLDLLLLAAAALGELIVVRTGALDATPGSVFEGRSVSLPSRLLVVPLLAWVGGALFAARLLLATAMRLRARARPRFGALVPGLVIRSMRRRPWELAAGIVALGLVVAFGTSLRAFIATYDAAKKADAAFVVGSDLRITPGVAGAPQRSAGYASQLRVGGVSGVTPVVSRLENSVLIGPYRRATTDLAAIDPGDVRQGGATDRLVVRRGLGG